MSFNSYTSIANTGSSENRCEQGMDDGHGRQRVGSLEMLKVKRNLSNRYNSTLNRKLVRQKMSLDGKMAELRTATSQAMDSLRKEAARDAQIIEEAYDQELRRKAADIAAQHADNQEKQDELLRSARADLVSQHTAMASRRVEAAIECGDDTVCNLAKRLNLIVYHTRVKQQYADMLRKALRARENNAEEKESKQDAAHRNMRDLENRIEKLKLKTDAARKITALYNKLINSVQLHLRDLPERNEALQAIRKEQKTGLSQLRQLRKKAVGDRQKLSRSAVKLENTLHSSHAKHTEKKEAIKKKIEKQLRKWNQTSDETVLEASMSDKWAKMSALVSVEDHDSSSPRAGTPDGLTSHDARFCRVSLAAAGRTSFMAGRTSFMMMSQLAQLPMVYHLLKHKLGVSTTEQMVQCIQRLAVSIDRLESMRKDSESERFNVKRKFYEVRKRLECLLYEESNGEREHETAYNTQQHAYEACMRHHSTMRAEIDRLRRVTLAARLGIDSLYEKVTSAYSTKREESPDGKQYEPYTSATDQQRDTMHQLETIEKCCIDLSTNVGVALDDRHRLSIVQLEFKTHMDMAVGPVFRRETKLPRAVLKDEKFQFIQLPRFDKEDNHFDYLSHDDIKRQSAAILARRRQTTILYTRNRNNRPMRRDNAFQRRKY